MCKSCLYAQLRFWPVESEMDTKVSIPDKFPVDVDAALLGSPCKVCEVKRRKKKLKNYYRFILCLPVETLGIMTETSGYSHKE